MKKKKSQQADLESKKGLYLQLGLIVALSLILIAFEWTTVPKDNSDLSLKTGITFESDMVVTRRKEPPREQSKPELPEVAEVLELVDNDVEIPDFDFENEVDGDTRIDFTKYLDLNDEIIEEIRPFVRVEEMPLFNGGDPNIEFMKYLSENLVYPKIAADNGVGGSVTVQFVVNEQGKVVDAKIIRSVDPALDKEALRVVLASPAWTPGKQRGKPVKVLFSFPIGFRLR